MPLEEPRLYNVEYLPLARQDMVEIVMYITRELNNPAAAERIAEQLIKAGESLRDFPYAQPSYTPLRPLKHEYRKLLVENYMMLYWVTETEKRVTIARVVYARRNYAKLLE